jgi:hypothetical protein
MRRLPVLSLIVLLASCRHGAGSPPDGVIGHDQFVKAYAALLENRGARPPMQKDTLAMSRGADSVLARFGATREQFQKTVAWYNADVQRWRGYMDEVTRILEERQQNRGQHP